MITVDEYLVFLDDALDGMTGIVSDLGDELANARPDIPGANSPYVVLTHCLGVIEHWAGHVVAGRTTERDRDAEFGASGPVADLVDRTHQQRAQLTDDLTTLDPTAPPRGTNGLHPQDTDLPLGRTQGGALIHLNEELAQHHGQMEITRDILHTPWAQLS